MMINPKLALPNFLNILSLFAQNLKERTKCVYWRN